MGLTPDGKTFADVQQYPNVQQVPGVLIVRLNGPVYFYNVNQLSADVLAAVTAVGEDLDAVVIDLRATARVDISSSDGLVELADELKRKDIALYLVVIEHVRRRLLLRPLVQYVDGDHLVLGLHQAVDAIGARTPVPAITPGSAPDDPASP